MAGSDTTVDIDRSSTPFPRSRRLERAHERVEDFNRRNPSPVRFSDASRPSLTRGRYTSPTRSRRLSPSSTRYRFPTRITGSARPCRLSPSPPRYRSPTRITSSTSRFDPVPSPYFKETRITKTRRTTYRSPGPIHRYTEISTTYRSPSPLSRYGSYSSGPRSEYVRPLIPPRAPISSTTTRYHTSPRVVDVRPPETYSASSRYDSYPPGPISEYVPARGSAGAKSPPARRGALSPRIIETSYKEYGAYRGDYSRRS